MHEHEIVFASPIYSQEYIDMLINTDLSKLDIESLNKYVVEKYRKNLYDSETLYIYKLGCEVTNNFYPGITKNFKIRNAQHFKKLEKGIFPYRELQQDYNNPNYREHFITEIVASTNNSKFAEIIEGREISKGKYSGSAFNKNSRRAYNIDTIFSLLEKSFFLNNLSYYCINRNLEEINAQKEEINRQKEEINRLKSEVIDLQKEVINRLKEENDILKDNDNFNNFKI